MAGRARIENTVVPAQVVKNIESIAKLQARKNRLKHCILNSSIGLLVLVLDQLFYTYYWYFLSCGGWLVNFIAAVF